MLAYQVIAQVPGQEEAKVKVFANPAKAVIQLIKWGRSEKFYEVYLHKIGSLVLLYWNDRLSYLVVTRDLEGADEILPYFRDCTKEVLEKEFKRIRDQKHSCKCIAAWDCKTGKCEMAYESQVDLNKGVLKL